MKNKKLNKALCSVMSVFLATNNLAFATNQSSARTHSLPQKIVKKVKNNKIAAGTLIFGTGLVIAGTIGLVLNSNKEKEVITKIQADEWFERLGGYKNNYIGEYIDNYKNFDVKATNALDDQQKENYKTIDKDVPRTESSFSENQKDMCLQILEKILKINVCEGTYYVQGFNDIAAMVINKFLRYSDHDCTTEDEAKIYYVYKTILKTVIDKDENGETDISKCNNRATELLKKYDLSTNSDRYDYYIIFIITTTLTSFSRFPLEFSISIWDNIIKNLPNTEFDSKYAFDKISYIATDITEKIAKNKENIDDNSLFKLLSSNNISKELIDFLLNEYPLA